VVTSSVDLHSQCSDQESADSVPHCLLICIGVLHHARSTFLPKLSEAYCPAGLAVHVVSNCIDCSCLPFL
jgi:hypothetical protein